MLSLVDCIAFSGLTPDQVDAVACHKHLPAIIAAEWAGKALETAEGRDLVEAVLISELAHAHAHHRACEAAWSAALADFRRMRLN